MTLNGVMALILRYFTEFCSFLGACRRKKFTFAHTPILLGGAYAPSPNPASITPAIKPLT